MFGSKPLVAERKANPQRPGLVIGTPFRSVSVPTNCARGGIVRVDGAVELVADEQVASEGAKGRGGKGHSPGLLEVRVRRGDQRLKGAVVQDRDRPLIRVGLVFERDVESPIAELLDVVGHEPRQARSVSVLAGLKVLVENIYPAVALIGGKEEPRSRA